MSTIEPTASSLSDSAALSALDSLKTEKGRDSLAPGLAGLGSNGAEDTVNVGMGQIYKSLTVLADKVMAKLQDLLGKDLPEGIASLKPEEHTPEKTAQRIVDGATALMSIYAKQNPNLGGEELISKFMEAIRGGIEQGYGEAADALRSIGAFELNGVESGIKETMKLVEEKLTAFETNWRKDNGSIADDPEKDEKAGKENTEKKVDTSA